eukprot:2091759-Rhodomonas_salina.1
MTANCTTIGAQEVEQGVREHDSGIHGREHLVQVPLLVQAVAQCEDDGLRAEECGKVRRVFGGDVIGEASVHARR